MEKINKLLNAAFDEREWERYFDGKEKLIVIAGTVLGLLLGFQIGGVGGALLGLLTGGVITWVLSFMALALTMLLIRAMVIGAMLSPLVILPWLIYNLWGVGS